MSQAYIAATYINAHTPKDASASAHAPLHIHLFDCWYASHKHIDADAINAHLGEPEGAGLYGFYRFPDGTSLLCMCSGPLAVIDADGGRWTK